MIYEVTNEGKTKFIGSVEDFMEWCKNRYNYEEERPYQLVCSPLDSFLLYLLNHLFIFLFFNHQYYSFKH